jgi:hypothetical protein
LRGPNTIAYYENCGQKVWAQDKILQDFLQT